MSTLKSYMNSWPVLPVKYSAWCFFHDIFVGGGGSLLLKDLGFFKEIFSTSAVIL